METVRDEGGAGIQGRDDGVWSSVDAVEVVSTGWILDIFLFVCFLFVNPHPFFH